MDKRRKFQGVLNILSFNRHFYIYGLLALFAICTLCLLFVSSTLLMWLIIGAFAYGLFMPLIVSAYVYDFSGYYNLHWLKKHVKETDDSKEIMNINAGFDETSFLLKDFFPNANIQVFDFYDSERHTEPAIIRARKVTQEYPNTRQIESSGIPVGNQQIDIVFLLSAAHEIRSHEEKIEFLKEVKRCVKPGGKVIMVEHLRDFPNFAAFTIGFAHFFSKKVWKNAFKSAGFNTIVETKFTPFMSVFNCAP